MITRDCDKCPNGKYGNPFYIKELSLTLCGLYTTHPTLEHLHYKCDKCGYIMWTFCMDHK